MSDLAKEYTIIIVTHSMQQAARVSQKTATFILEIWLSMEILKKYLFAPKTLRLKPTFLEKLVKKSK